MTLLSKSATALGVKKNTCGSGSRPTLFFSAYPIIFSTRLTMQPHFSGWLRAAAKMASVVTLIIEKTMKKRFKKKIISNLLTLIFSRY